MHKFAKGNRLTPVTARQAFSFAEVLFAVMILGIGFIMVAAMFPVAIKQTKSTIDETNAAGLALTASDIMNKLSSNGLMVDPPFSTADVVPPPRSIIRGRVLSLRDERFTNGFFPPGAPPYPAVNPSDVWATVSGNLISSSDPRYAWVPMYRRDSYFDSNLGGYVPSPFAEIIMIGTQVQNHSTYSTVDLHRYNQRLLMDMPGEPPAALEPALLPAQIIAQFTPLPQIIIFNPLAGDRSYKVNGPILGPEDRLAEGCFVVISDDGISMSNASQGLYNGRILRLGKVRPDMLTAGGSNHQVAFELAPGYEMPAGIRLPNLTDPMPKVFVVGRGYQYMGPLDFTAAHGEPSMGFDGAAQDLSVYVSYVRVP